MVWINHSKDHIHLENYYQIHLWEDQVHYLVLKILRIYNNNKNNNKNPSHKLIDYLRVSKNLNNLSKIIVMMWL